VDTVRATYKVNIKQVGTYKNINFFFSWHGKLLEVVDSLNVQKKTTVFIELKRDCVYLRS
jgi:hypothetical protein